MKKLKLWLYRFAAGCLGNILLFLGGARADADLPEGGYVLYDDHSPQILGLTITDLPWALLVAFGCFLFAQALVVIGLLKKWKSMVTIGEVLLLLIFTAHTLIMLLLSVAQTLVFPTQSPLLMLVALAMTACFFIGQLCLARGLRRRQRKALWTGMVLLLMALMLIALASFRAELWLDKAWSFTQYQS